MNATSLQRPPLGVRLLHALVKEPDWSTMTAEELVSFGEAATRKATSPLARVITGLPDRGAVIRWQEVRLPGRMLRVRVYRPSPKHGRGSSLPLVMHVHGGGFMGSAVQSDWLNSHLAARLPAVVVSVDHRLLAPGIPLSAVVDDGWDVLRHILRNAAEWGVDPARTAVVGESTGALVVALAAIRARHSGQPLQAQVLVNPALDVTETALNYASVAEHAHTPTLTVERVCAFLRLAVPPGTDPHAVSPLRADDLSGLAQALVVVPVIDPVADQGRSYAERLRESGTPVRLTEHPGATHAFLSMPGVVPQARTARAEIAEFLRACASPAGSMTGLRDSRADYGIDAPLTGLLPPAAGGLTVGALSAYHYRRGRRALATVELLGSLPALLTAAVYLHATRRGKFDVWAELLADLHLRGDEHCLDMGCGRGAVMAMLAELVPRGHVVGLDLWRTEDQSGNSAEMTRHNLVAEGVAERCELRTGDMLAMPFADDTFDLVVSSLAIHNIDERDLHNHTRRLQAVSEAVRVLKPGGRLLITDLLWTRRYAQHLRQLGMRDVTQRSLGWRFWYAPFLGADLVTATKPAAG